MLIFEYKQNGLCRHNKANLRDFIAATGLVILLKLEWNHPFFSHVTLKFDWWPWKIIGQIFYITSSCVHYLKPLSEFELQLLSGNAQFGWKSAILLPCVNLKLNGWPWETIGILFYITLSFVHHFKAIGEFKLKLQSETLNSGQNGQIFAPCDLKIWWITFKNNRAPLLCCCKLCA